MRRFLAIAVSVKSGMTILVKGDSLFFKGRPNYTGAMQTPIFVIAIKRWRYRRDRWKQKNASL
jgi:hypothetical protein